MDGLHDIEQTQVLQWFTCGLGDAFVSIESNPGPSGWQSPPDALLSEPPVRELRDDH